MRGAWGTLVTLGSYLIMGAIVATMASDYVGRHGTFLRCGGGEANMAMATASRMRTLIGHLQVR